MLKRIVLAAVVVAAVLVGWGASVAKSEEVVCSPMRGQLVDLQGNPATGIEIRREWFWRGKTGNDHTVTDNGGHFAFEAAPARKGLFGFLPSQDAVTQRYFAKVAGGEFEFLYITRRELSLNGETAGRAFKVRCVAGGEQGSDGFAWGTCDLVP